MPYYYGYGFGVDPSYLLLVIVSLVLGMLTQSYINRTYRTWSHVPSGGATGADVARRMLDANACHEAGHAAQREQGYFMMRVRAALVPVVNFTQNIWMLVFMLGVFMNVAGLTTLAIALFAFSVIFQLVTLPVEINASRRAVAYIEQSGMGDTNVRGAKKVLTAAALTYVAAALTSILKLLYLLGRTRDDD